MPKLKYWIWLSTAKVWSKTKARLIEYYGDAERAFYAPEGEFAKIPGITPSEAAILEKREISHCHSVAEECRRQDIRIISCLDPDYPERLRNIYFPPPVIYVKGKLPLIDELPVISVIGTRKASPYGIKMSRILSHGIARCGGTVLSLTSSALDQAAYKGAQMAGGGCIAVLPYAHEKEDWKVIDDICSNGAVISEYAPGTVTVKGFFRDRNRLAAALSVGVLVVEAPAKSGTMLFVEEAVEMGREIFAVPGNVDSDNSAGTLALIKDGAKLVTCSEDIMREFVHIFPEKVRIKPDGEVPEIPEVKTDSPKPVRKAEKAADIPHLRQQLSGLNEEELKIISAIDSKPTHVDDIIENTGISASKVLGHLTMLEIKGFVKRESGRHFSLNTSKK